MQTHPVCCTDPTCELAYVDHLRGFGVSAHATPNRRPDTVRIDRTEARWSKDHAAYKRIHRDVPNLKVDGSHEIERRS